MRNYHQQNENNKAKGPRPILALNSSAGLILLLIATIVTSQTSGCGPVMAALSPSAGSPISTVTNGQQQHQHQQSAHHGGQSAGMGAPTPQGVSAGPSQSHKQQQQQQQAAAPDSISVNLIPIDKPIGSSATELKSEPPSMGQSGPPGAPSTSDERQAESDLFEANGQLQLQQQQQSAEAAGRQQLDDFSLDEQLMGQLYQTEQLPLEHQQQQQQQQQQHYAHQQAQSQQSQNQHHQLAGTSDQSVVERRFGLFKKGHGGHQAAPFGQPLMMGANYLQAPNPFGSSDCERCLASLQQPSAGPTFGEYQTIDTPIPAPPPPPPPIMQQPQSQLIPMGGYSPIKSKLLMKFPFFIKSGSGGGLSSLVQSHQGFGTSPHAAFSWPLASATGYHQHLPAQRPTSGALYLRQAPSYNCIQAQPPLLAAAASSPSSQSADLIAPPHHSPSASKDGGLRYHHHHQSPALSGTKHYSGASQQQQLVYATS